MAKRIDEEIEVTLQALKRRGLDARFAENRRVARQMVAAMVPEHWIVGCGDSATIRSIGVLQDLMDMGNRVLDYHIWPKIMREKPQRVPLRVMKQTSQGCDVFLSSSNAVTMDGKLVNIDGAGIRVTGMVFGPLLSIVVVGKNKIVRDVDAALHRIKNVIAPFHLKTIGWDSPCVAAGQCVEPATFCQPERRACNVTVVLESRPSSTDIDIAVIIVDEDLGLGWDPAWPQERTGRIQAEYIRWTPPHGPRR
ncbi:MAG: lactate utilization protein [Chloroflexi bacterium]|nr:lactate utilization protein [Chloroflexota bacterium]